MNFQGMYTYIYSVINIFFHPPNYYSKLMKHVCFPGKFLLEICSGVVCGGWRLEIVYYRRKRCSIDAPSGPSNSSAVNYFGNWRCEESVNVKVWNVFAYPCTRQITWHILSEILTCHSTCFRYMLMSLY